MQGQGSATGPLPEALEFEDRFMPSGPISSNPFRWHHEQNPPDQQLPDFIPLPSGTIVSHHSSVGQAGWNAERLNLGQSSCINMKKGSGCVDRHMENGRTSSSNAYAGVGSGSSNLPHLPTMGSYQGNSNGSSTNDSNHNLIRPVVVRNSRSEITLTNLLTNATSSGHGSTEHISTASSSAHPLMNLYQTSSIFREENIDGPDVAAVTSHSSDKRKSPEGSWDESAASASKRSVHIAGSSGLHASSSSHIPGGVLNISSSSANIFGLGSLGESRSETVPPTRYSLFDRPEPGTARSDRNVQQNLYLETNTSLQNSALSRTGIRDNNYRVIQRPLLVRPPPQAVGEGLNVQNHSMSVHYPVTPQQSVQLAGHHSGSSTIPGNTSGSVFTMSTAQREEMVLRNSTQSLHIPAIVPPVGSRNLTWNAMNFRPSGGNVIIPENTALGSLSDPIPSRPLPVPNNVAIGNRQHRSDQIRQALLAVDSMSPSQEIGMQVGADSHGPQMLLQRAMSLQIPGHNHSNSGAPDPISSTYAYDSETRQRFLSRARQIIAIYRGGRDIQPFEDGVNFRQSLLSALASIHDQHRDMRLDVDNMSYEELLGLGERIGNVKTGLSEERIMKCLTHNKYASIMESNKPVAEPCSICQEEYAEGEELGTLHCGHEYHRDCIKQWLVLKNSCPICKAAASSST